ncbi:hypothetical protein A3A03_00395 [Candidatus Nomurabacteria bacterium RIFCSPLOWO2_01_FULL_40_18]|uniref:FCP1 homology domain-containing protein n=1 Tax=Candidatus Nomurabacteria bacterium RIFCSPLOWO2_01_FULL_40_18 TaxID=1801773 RepID=A0A1F6XHH5_9BACT|nr:MAG: hypothetical protein A3A03_00395 [Candidatus Nomurabacteria bacterium RIFCSPLOWO2_01_FULL_40_18]
MIKAVIFDLNGIFVQAPRLGERLEKDFGLKQEIFLPNLHRIMHEIRKRNAKPAFSYWGPFLQEHKINFSEKDFWNYWFGSEKVSEQMVAFSKKLKQQGIKVFVLSNNFKERSEYYGLYPWIHEAVDKVYFSWQTGFIKPNLAAWQLVLSKNNLKPEECIYFDDKEKNLKASEEVGIKAFQFTNEQELERIVNEELNKK